ncbi:putative reverse transcriptase domain-containing protein [Tanacetum coccineum]
MVNGRNEKTNKIVRGCTLVLEDISFSIDLLPFELRSFDVVVWMDWLSKHRAEIICHKKIIRVLLLNGEILEVREEQPKEDRKHLLSIKTDEKKLKYIPNVRDFPEVFLEDILGLPLAREVEFRLNLISEATPVAKSPYRLAPSEIQELSNQLQEFQDKGFI